MEIADINLDVMRELSNWKNLEEIVMSQYPIDYDSKYKCFGYEKAQFLGDFLGGEIYSIRTSGFTENDTLKAIDIVDALDLENVKVSIKCKYDLFFEDTYENLWDSRNVDYKNKVPTITLSTADWVGENGGEILINSFATYVLLGELYDPRLKDEVEEDEFNTERWYG